MTKEDKNLLLKGLCAMLPYGLKVQYTTRDGMHIDCGVDMVSIASERVGIFELDTSKVVWRGVENIKPYLRPMSSMTEEEKTEIGNFAAAGMFTSQNMNPLFGLAVKALYGDFFEKRHIDYRGLIPIGLALEAPEDMYK